MNQEASPDWNILLEPFQSLFSKPGFRYFCVFVRVFAHLDGRLWDTSVVLSRLLDRQLDELLSLPALGGVGRGGSLAAGLCLVPAGAQGRVRARLRGDR